MRFGSLFSGIGGMDLGLEWAGHECAWQVENDEYASRVLAKHWPDVTRYGDIREVDFGGVESVELLAGGFPCQDLSYAGKGLGLSGPRSGLWSEFKRAICVVRPQYILVENVSGLLGRGMGAVLGDLAALGYDAEWQSLPAAAFGAPHLRWRVFIIAYSRGDQHESGGDALGRTGSEELSLAHAGRECDERRRESGELGGSQAAGEGEESQREWVRDASFDSVPLVADSDMQRLENRVFGPSSEVALRGAKRQGGGDGGIWSVEPAVGRVAPRVPARLDRLRGLGNAVVPQVAQYLGELVAEHEEAA